MVSKPSRPPQAWPPSSVVAPMTCVIFASGNCSLMPSSSVTVLRLFCHARALSMAPASYWSFHGRSWTYDVAAAVVLGARVITKPRRVRVRSDDRNRLDALRVQRQRRRCGVLGLVVLQEHGGFVGEPARDLVVLRPRSRRVRVRRLATARRTITPITTCTVARVLQNTCRFCALPARPPARLSRRGFGSGRAGP